MSKVKTLVISCADLGEDVTYVAYEDYAALKAECESNLKSAQYSAETNRKISRKNGEMHDEITSLKADLDALASENAALKELYKGAVKELDDTCFEIGMMRGEKAMEYPAPDTPATDAYANQLRAEELSEAVEIINEKAADYAHGTLEWEACHWLATTLNRKAANLVAGDDRCERCGVRFTRPDGAHYCHKN